VILRSCYRITGNRFSCARRDARTHTENKAKIDNFLKGKNNQIIIIQKTKHPVGTSFKKNSTSAVSGKEIYLIIRKAPNMHTGYRIHTGFSNP
jgi:hypothetical protein